MSSLQQDSGYQGCQFVVGYRHVELCFTVCIECFDAIRQLKLHKSYVRFSLLMHQIQQQACLANCRLNNFVSQQVGSLKQLLQSQAIQNHFVIKEYSQNSAKLSLSTDQGSEKTRETSADATLLDRNAAFSDRYGEAMNDLIDRIQPTKQIFLKKAEGLLGSAASVKQRCQVIRSECRALAAEIPTLKSIKKGINGFFRFF